jgi:uncharacterized membrane protein (UPF0136 family)
MTDKAKQMETSLVIVAGLIAGYFLKHSGVWLIAGFIIGAGSALIPGFAGIVHWGWTKLGLLMGNVTGKILLTLVYIVVLLPLACFARLSGKSGMKGKGGRQSYFTVRDHRYEKEDLVHPW